MSTNPQQVKTGGREGNRRELFLGNKPLGKSGWLRSTVLSCDSFTEGFFPLQGQGWAQTLWHLSGWCSLLLRLIPSGVIPLRVRYCRLQILSKNFGPWSNSDSVLHFYFIAHFRLVVNSFTLVLFYFSSSFLFFFYSQKAALSQMVGR